MLNPFKSVEVLAITNNLPVMNVTLSPERPSICHETVKRQRKEAPKYTIVRPKATVALMPRTLLERRIEDIEKTGRDIPRKKRGVTIRTCQWSVAARVS